MQGQLIVLCRLFFIFVCSRKVYMLLCTQINTWMRNVTGKFETYNFLLFDYVGCPINQALLTGSPLHCSFSTGGFKKIAVSWPAVVQLAIFWSAVQYIIKKNWIYIRIRRKYLICSKCSKSLLSGFKFVFILSTDLPDRSETFLELLRLNVCVKKMQEDVF